MFSTHEMKYIWYLPEKIFFILYFFIDYMQYVSPTVKEGPGAENGRTKNLANLNNFGTKLFVTF